MALPKIEPVRPRLENHVPTGRGWSYELKLDGFRGVLHIEGRRAYFVSKHGRVMKRFQALADALAATLEVRSAILDGEIVAKRWRDPYGPDTEWVKVKHPGDSQMEGRWQLFGRQRARIPQ